MRFGNTAALLKEVQDDEVYPGMLEYLNFLSTLQSEVLGISLNNYAQGTAFICWKRALPRRPVFLIC